MADIVKDYNGTLDKYIGDAVMSFWGAPIDQADHALLACKCALKQMEQLAVLNQSWEEHERIDIGIGISTGIMTAGFMGSADRLSYTVIGDAVNLGSRLEGMNKMYYDTGKGRGNFSRIIISENTYEQVKDKVIARELDVVRVKGKQEPAVIYELHRHRGRFRAAEASARRRGSSSPPSPRPTAARASPGRGARRRAVGPDGVGEGARVRRAMLAAGMLALASCGLEIVPDLDPPGIPTPASPLDPVFRVVYVVTAVPEFHGYEVYYKFYSSDQAQEDGLASIGELNAAGFHRMCSPGTLAEQGLPFEPLIPVDIADRGAGFITELNFLAADDSLPGLPGFRAAALQHPAPQRRRRPV